MTVLQVIHCSFDVLVTFVLIGLAWETTDDWSFFGTRQQKWAAYRRIAYSLMGVGFFARAMMIAEPRMDVQIADLLSAACIAGPIVFFLAVRALGLVSQDHWMGIAGYRQHRSNGIHGPAQNGMCDWPG